MRSISTSAIWLTPTMATLTMMAAISVARRSPAVTLGPAFSAAAIAYRPATDSALPMIVCGREKRHSTLAARVSAPLLRSTAATTAAGAERQDGGDRHERGPGRRAEHETGCETERADGRIGCGGRGRGGARAGRGLDAAHGERVRRVAVAAVPVGRERRGPDAGEARGREPALVLA